MPNCNIGLGFGTVRCLPPSCQPDSALRLCAHWLHGLWLCGLWIFGSAVLCPPGLAQSQAQHDEEFLPGLVATFHDEKHSLKWIAPTPNFYLDAGESIHPSLSPNFEAEWVGLLSILQTGNYQLDSGSAQVFIDGKTLDESGVQLETGRYPIRIEYQRQPGKAAMRLSWKAGHFPLEPIAASRFSHRLAMQPDPQTSLIEHGRHLVEELGCLNCHATDSASLRGRLGPDLTAIGKRVSSRWLYQWLADPSAFRSGSVMPGQLDEQQRRDVTTYLLSLSSGGDFEHGRMSNERGPFFGLEAYSTIGCAACHEQPGLGLDGMGSKMSVEALQTYLKDPLHFDPGGRMPSMMLSDQEAYNLAAMLTRSRNEAFERPWQPGDADRGRELMASIGCLSCHTLQEAGLVNKHIAPRLEQLSPLRGCLASAPRGVPIYDLSENDSMALLAFLRAYQTNPDVSPAPLHDFRRRVQQLGCVTCHEMQGGGHTAALAERTPSLVDAGDKLRSRWIDGVMMSGRRAQEKTKLRMPGYDPSYVSEFGTTLAKLSAVDPTSSGVEPSSSEEKQTAGVRLLGTAMACIGCHGFGEHAPLGEDGPYLTHTGERLRYPWFQRWMRNPARILSGTSMPNYFSSTDPAQAEGTIETLWAALAMGTRMPVPAGFPTNDVAPDAEARPIPTDEAIVVRWSLPETTPAAIAVGLPGNVSYCFDAGEVRLRYAWLGGFVDMTGTLTEKKDSATNLTRTADLLGDIFYRSSEFPLRMGSVDRVPPRRFRGYRWIDGHPQFHYRVGDAHVYERVVAADGNQGIVRHFTISGVSEPTWFLTEAAEGLRVTSSLGPPVDGRLRIPEGSDVRFSVTIVKRRGN